MLRGARRAIRLFSTNTKKSKYRGVKFNDSGVKKWSVILRVQGNSIDGGQFWTEEDAARAYDELAAIYHGKTAKLNFSREETEAFQRNQDKAAAAWERPDKTRSDPLSVIPIRSG